MDGKGYWREQKRRRKNISRSSVRIGRERALFVLCRLNSQNGRELRQPVTRAAKSRSLDAAHYHRCEASSRW
ncbi:MAG: hypothetical protein QOG66_2353 [Methylobacteriaceae bacterium]|nr:hypothetical protein [Methylobacteriaceae bacterium]